MRKTVKRLTCKFATLGLVLLARTAGADVVYNQTTPTEFTQFACNGNNWRAHRRLICDIGSLAPAASRGNCCGQSVDFGDAPQCCDYPQLDPGGD
jgi:hypothetical protein